MPVSGVYIGDQRVRIELKHGSRRRTAGNSRPSQPPPPTPPTPPPPPPPFSPPRRPSTPSHPSMDGYSRGAAPLSPPSRIIHLDKPKGGSSEKAGGFSGGGAPGGHSRLSSADSGIQVDSSWDSLTRSHAKVPADSAGAPPDSKISLKTVYSCHTQGPAPAKPSEQSCRVQAPARFTHVGAVPCHADATTVAATAAHGMTQGDDVRGRALSPEPDVTVTCEGAKSRAISRRPGVSRRINIKVLGPKSTSKDSSHQEANGRTAATHAHYSSAESVKNLVTNALKANVPASREGPRGQSGQTNSRSMSVHSVPKHSELDASSLVFESRGSSSHPRLPTEHSTSDSKLVEISLKPSKSSVQYRPGAPSEERSVHVEPISSSKMVRSKVGVSGQAKVVSPRSHVTSALTPSPKPVNADRKNPCPLTLVTSNTPVIPTLPPRGDGVTSPKGGDWVVGGRGMFSSQSELASKGAVRPGCPPAKVTVSSSDVSLKPSHGQRGVKIFQDGHRGHGTAPNLSQHSQPKMLSVPVRFVKNVSDERSGNIDVHSDRPGDGRAQVLSGHSQASAGAQVRTDNLPVPQHKGPDPYSHSTPPQSSSHTSYTGTPVESFQCLIIPDANSSQSTGTSKSATSPVRPATSPHHLSPSRRVVTEKSHPLPPSPSRAPAPVYQSKLSPVMPRHTHRLRLPAAAGPAPPVLQPIPVRHVNRVVAALKTDTSPASPDNQSGVPTVNVTSVSSNGVVTSSPPEVLLRLLEMTAVGGVRDEGGGQRSAVERTIPVVDARKEVPWKERRKRMDSALSWLREELECLRAMDTELVSQFQRCQETIESLKQQHSEQMWGDGEGSDWGWGWGLEGSEVGEEEGAWEDWEIAEFEKKWADGSSAKQSDITSRTTSSIPSNDDATEAGADLTEGTSSTRENTPSPFLQDVEASL